MSGKMKGVKTRILEDNPQAYFSPCTAHSLNLCGIHVMEVNVEVKTYFGNIQKLFNLFSLSPARWKILQETANISLHPVSKTRWSARIDAVLPLVKNYNGIIESLEKIEALDLPAEIQADVDGLTKWMTSFEFILLTSVWYKILQCLNDRNKILQSIKLTVTDGADCLHSLIDEIEVLGNSWNAILEEAKQTASDVCIVPELKEKRRRKRKVFFDEDPAIESFDDPELRFKTHVFKSTIDLLLTELSDLHNRLEEMAKLFSPILCSADNTNSTSLNEGATCLAEAYPNDILKDELVDELRFFCKIQKDYGLLLDGNMNSSLKVLNFIYEKGLENVFPQICICLRLLIVLPVSVASGERAFSKLKLIKNRLRSTMGQDRLNHLLILSIEYKKARDLDFDNVIQDFARAKARKVCF